MKRRRFTPYALMSPGLFWLLLFFAVPMFFMAIVALEEGSIDTGFALTWKFSNFSDALSSFDTQFIRSFKFSIIATILCLLIAYPLAYAIAIKAGRWKNLMLFAVVAPFFTTYLIRTLAWQTILTDDGTIADIARTFAFIPEGGRLLDTDFSVIMGITYNFLPFMVLPIYASLEQLDGRLIEAAKDLGSSARSAFVKVTLPLTAPRDHRRHPAHLHPGLRRLRQRNLPRWAQPGDDRQRDPGPVPAHEQLPDRLGALLHGDGGDPRDRDRLHQVRRLRIADGRGRGPMSREGLTVDAANVTHGPAAPTRAWRWVREHAVMGVAILAVAYTLIPILVIAVFSFNDPKGKFNFTWEGFTLSHWRTPSESPSSPTPSSSASSSRPLRRSSQPRSARCWRSAWSATSSRAGAWQTC